MVAGTGEQAYARRLRVRAESNMGGVAGCTLERSEGEEVGEYAATADPAAATEQSPLAAVQ